ncbi:MAG TPA: tannase/feruloyl esterase family alpha/beta hydrolase, partial [Novosphingobium sp.]|nr:tannase/feruloyl esterase family alpha/beta hydrolase [Novosphingobium sp.]
NAYDSFDLLGAVVDWVEHDTPAQAVTASRRDGSATMPLCPYPAYAAYVGGDATQARSFACRMPDKQESAAQ